MDKGWKQGKHIPLDTAVQVETWKQKVGFEKRQAHMRTATQIISMKD